MTEIHNPKKAKKYRKQVLLVCQEVCYKLLI